MAGFDISRGCLACGVVPSHRDEHWLFCYLQQQQLLLQRQTNVIESLLPDSNTTVSHSGGNCSSDEIANATTPLQSSSHADANTDNGDGVLLRILALDEISDTANLGAVIRTASALGVHVVVLSVWIVGTRSARLTSAVW